MTETYIEKRKRGVFGWLFLLVFLGWNLLMFSWLMSYGSETGGRIDAAASDAEMTVTVIGAGIGITSILMVWAFGAVITGLLAVLTRGGKTVVTRKA